MLERPDIKASNTHVEHTLIFLLMGGFLAVDSLVGFIEVHFGVHIKASLIYKTPVLLIILVILSQRDQKFFLGIVTAIMLMLVGPIFQLAKFSDQSAIINDFTLILKIVSPIIYYKYFTVVIREIPQQFVRYGPLILNFNFFVLGVNIMAGIAGLGYASYSSSEGGIGVNGYFAAGNELGAVLVILSSYALSRTYVLGLRPYFFMSMLTVSIGFLISTKTSILSSVALVFLLPVVIQGRQYFKPTNTKIIISIVGFSALVLGVFTAIEFLKELGLWKRLIWLYEEHGLLRVILSGRDEFAQELFNIFSEHGFFSWMFGLGSATLYNHWLPVKPFAEIDPVDVLITFGFIGLLVTSAIYLYLLKEALSAWKKRRSPMTSAAILTYFVLLGLAFTSGHVWLSGMLGPFLALILGLASLESIKSTPYRTNVGRRKPEYVNYQHQE